MNYMNLKTNSSRPVTNQKLKQGGSSEQPQKTNSAQIVQKILVGVIGTVAGAYTVKYLRKSKLL